VSLLQKREGVVPLFATHGDNAEIGIGGTRARVDGNDGAELFLRELEVAATQSGLTFGEYCQQVSVGAIG
jgi:hypothetical protein